MRMMIQRETQMVILRDENEKCVVPKKVIVIKKMRWALREKSLV